MFTFDVPLNRLSILVFNIRYDNKLRASMKPSAQPPMSPPRSPPLPNQVFGVPLQM